jgi:hypothetical protein
MERIARRVEKPCHWRILQPRKGSSAGIVALKGIRGMVRVDGRHKVGVGLHRDTTVLQVNECDPITKIPRE